MAMAAAWANALEATKGKSLVRHYGQDTDTTPGNNMLEDLSLTALAPDGRGKVHDKSILIDVQRLADAAAGAALDLSAKIEEAQQALPQRIRDRTIIQAATSGATLLLAYHFDKQYSGNVDFIAGTLMAPKLRAGRAGENYKKAFQTLFVSYGQRRVVGFRFALGGNGEGQSGEFAQQASPDHRKEPALSLGAGQRWREGCHLRLRLAAPRRTLLHA